MYWGASMSQGRLILLYFVRRLIDDRASVDDINQPPRHLLGKVCQGNQPDGDDGRLAEARREVARLRNVVFTVGNEAIIERLLPREGLVASRG